jgi:flagellar hook-associated protein 2
MLANVASIANSGSLYEQLIGQVLAIESQPRLKLRAEQTEQGVYKGVLSDFQSKVSALDAALDKLQDPFRSPFSARATTTPEGAGFTATASDEAALGQHDVRVDRLARADARLSKQLADGGAEIADLFVEPGEPGDPGTIFRPPTPPTPDRIVERQFTVQIAQPDGADPVDLVVAYTPDEGATDGDVVKGIAAAVNGAVEAARADGTLAEGTGVAASVIRETDGTSRLSLRGLATGYDNRIAVSDDPDGIAAALEVDRTAVRSGAGGGAVHAVGTGPENSDLSAALTFDGLTVYRNSNTVDDLVDGLTLTLEAVTDEVEALEVGPDAEAMRGEVEAFVEAYNGVVEFLSNKQKVDGEAGTRGPLAGDAGLSGLRFGMRADLVRDVAEGLPTLAQIGVTTERTGTLKITDGAALSEALAARPESVGALLGGADGLAERLASRIDGLLGSDGTIARRKEGVDARVRRLDAQIERWDTRLARREEALRSQFAQLEELSLQAQSQQASIASLFFF